MIVLLSVLVLIVGLLMYILCANPKLSEAGRIMFFCGLFVTLLGAKAVIGAL